MKFAKPIGKTQLWMRQCLNDDFPILALSSIVNFARIAVRIASITVSMINSLPYVRFFCGFDASFSRSCINASQADCLVTCVKNRADGCLPKPILPNRLLPRP